MDDFFTPHRGAFAFCSRGELGLITSEAPVEVTYKVCDSEQHTSFTDGCRCEKGFAWVGFHLSPVKFGEPWSSRAPRVVGEIAYTSGLFLVRGRSFTQAVLHL